MKGWRWAADGIIDDVRIYNRALSETEIQGLVAQAGTAASEPTKGDAAAGQGEPEAVNAPERIEGGNEPPNKKKSKNVPATK